MREGFTLAHEPVTTPKVAVNAVVFNERGEVLLARRSDNGLWCLPGGHVELGETLAEACLRELREETGLEAEVLGLAGVYSDLENSLHIAQGLEWHTVRVSVRCRVKGGEPVPSAETLEVGWFPLEALPPLITDHARRIRDALAEDGRAVLG